MENKTIESNDLDFSEKEMDKIIRQTVDRIRANYFQNGATAKGIPAEVKRIIEANIDRV